MPIDQRAHDRIDGIEHKMEMHRIEHERFEKSLQANTELTQTIANNTTELVDLVKGAKGLRSFVIWASPIAAFFVAAYAWIKAH